MFVPAKNVEIVDVGEYRGRFNSLASIKQAVKLDEVVTPGPLFDGRAYLVDWTSPDLFAALPPAAGELETLRVLARKASYFEMLIMHEGAHPAIKQYINERLKGTVDPKFHHRSIDEIYQSVAQVEPTNNPLARPAPVGLSISIVYRTDKELKLIAAERSEHLAINPGIWTTAVDEGMHIPNKAAILTAALEAEAGFTYENARQSFAQLRCRGFHAPEPDTIGPRAGGNVLYELIVDSLDELHQIASHINGSNGWACVETSNALVVDGLKLGDEIPHEKTAPILRHAAHLGIPQ